MRAVNLVIVFVLCLGCAPIMKTAYGIKKPRVETKPSVKSYLAKRNVDTSNVFVFKDMQSFLAAAQKNMVNFPEAIFFNKQGNMVRYKKEAEDCNAKVNDFLDDLNSFANQPEDKSVTMDQFLTMLSKSQSVEKADINVFITWTIYSGRLNKTKAFEWIKLIDKARANGIDAKVYLLNCDYQQSWNLPPELLDKLGVKY